MKPGRAKSAAAEAVEEGEAADAAEEAADEAVAGERGSERIGRRAAMLAVRPSIRCFETPGEEILDFFAGRGCDRAGARHRERFMASNRRPAPLLEVGARPRPL